MPVVIYDGDNCSVKKINLFDHRPAEWRTEIETKMSLPLPPSGKLQKDLRRQSEKPPLMKTSVSHPLQIATIAPGMSGFGRVGVTFCPGKYDPHAMSGGWDRDLAVDLDAIRDWGAAAIVTLVEPKELTLLEGGTPRRGGSTAEYAVVSPSNRRRVHSGPTVRRKVGVPPGRSCGRSCGTAPTFWSIAAEGSDEPAR